MQGNSNGRPKRMRLMMRREPLGSVAVEDFSPDRGGIGGVGPHKIDSYRNRTDQNGPGKRNGRKFFNGTKP